MKYIYTGVFFDQEELQNVIDKITKTRLYRVIDNPHITFAFRPSKIDPALFGKKATFNIIGYACDENNQGVSVYLHVTESSELLKEFLTISNPHVTISVSEIGKPVNTGKLDFIPLNRINSELVGNLEITGTYGGFIGAKVDYSGKL